MLGIGGGVIFVPTLYYLLPFAGINHSIIPYFAISMSLFAGAIAASFSGILHLRLKNADKKKAILFSLGSGLSAFIAATFVTSVHPFFLKGLFAGLLFFISISIFLDAKIKSLTIRTKPLNEIALPFIGLFVGILSAFTGLGGGIIFFPVLHYLYLLGPKKAIGTSSVITSVTMLSASFSFFINRGGWIQDYKFDMIFLMIAVPLGIGALIGARVGVNFIIKMKTAWVKRIFAVLLIIVVIKIIFDLW